MKRFDGKTAWWLWLLFGIYNLVPIAIIVFYKDFTWSAATIIGVILCYLVNIIWLPIMIRDYVDVYEDYFIFYYGFIKITIQINTIVSATKNHNPIAKNTSALDRVCITKNNGKSFYLSLYKNDEFIELVKSKIKIETSSKK